MKSLYLLFTFAIFSIKAQTITPIVFGSDGGYSTSASGSISWSMGEPISESYNSAQNITTMGFQQPEINLPTLIREQGAEASMLVYPNPFVNEIKINFSGMTDGNYNLEIVDALGKLIYTETENISKNSPIKTIKVSEYAAGNYFLIISNPDFHKNIKITKTNQN